MKTECLKISFKHRKLFLGIVGYPLQDLIKQKGLIIEILKTLGTETGIQDFMDPSEIFDISIAPEYPDYLMELKGGRIKVMNFL